MTNIELELRYDWATLETTNSSASGDGELSVWDLSGD